MDSDTPQPEQPPLNDTSVDEPHDGASVSGTGKGKRRLRRATIAVAVGTGLIGLLQWLGRSTDHQIANIVSVVVGAITALYALYQLHRFAATRGHQRLVPMLSLLSVLTLVVMFRFAGFSGEMMPQFEFRFAQQRPELRSLDESDRLASPDGVPADERTAEADSLGFLGSDRTGVIERRSFAIPTDESQLKSLWNQKDEIGIGIGIGIGEGWSSFAVAGDRAVTLEQRDEMECVTCYRLSDGELLWMVDHEARHQHPLGGVGPRSTPTILGDSVYAQGATGRLWCLDLNSGKTHWSVDLLELAGWDQIESEAAISWGRAGSPLLVDGLCVVPFGGPEANARTGRSLIALDAQTGKTRWTAGEDQISYASPGLLTLGGLRQIVTVNESTITGHQVEDGKVLWEFAWPGQSNGGANCAMVIEAGEDRFLIGKGYGGGSALVEVKSLDDGSFEAEGIWESTRVLKTKFTHACIDGPIAYAISNGSLEAVTVDDGQRQWIQPRGSRFGQGQIVLVEDVLVAQAEPGEVALVAADPAEYRELLRLPAMESKTWNIPTVAGRHLLVRNDRRAICFLLPKREAD